MKNKQGKKYLAIVLMLSFIFSNTAYVKAAEVQRREYVFSTFENGKVNEEKTVSVWQSNADQNIDFSEKTNLKDIINLKSTDPVDQNSNTINWKLNSKDLYYQGKSNEDLPIAITLESKLNGQDVNYSELNKANGHLEIKIKLENKEYEDVEIAGKTRRIYRPYLADIAFVGDDASVENLKCNVGDITKDGSRFVLNAVLIPNINQMFKADLDDLEIDDLAEIKDYLQDELILEMDVKDFAAQSIMIGFSNIDLNNEKLKQANDLDSLRKSIQDLKDNGEKLSTGGKKISEGQGKFSEAVDQLSTGVDQLASGTNMISAGMNEVNSNTSKTLEASEQLLAGSDNLAKGAAALKTGSGQYKIGVEQYSSNMAEYTKQINGFTAKLGDSKDLDKLSEATKALQDGSSTIDHGLSQANDSFNQLNQKNKELSDQYTAFDAGLKQLNGNGETLNESSHALNAAGHELSSGIAQLNTSMAEVNRGSTDLAQAAQSFAAAIPESASSEVNGAVIQNNLKEIGTALQALSENPAIQNDPDMLNILNSLNATFELEKNNAALLKDSSDQLNGMVSSLKANAEAINNGASSLNEGITKATGGVTALSQNTQKFVQSYDQYQESADQYFTAMNELTENSGLISAGIKQIYLNQSALLEAYQKLGSGANQVSQGTQQLNEKALEVTKKVNQYLPKIGQLGDATNQLNQGSILLKDNYLQLNSGIGQLQAGSTELNSSLSRFQNGLAQLYDQGTSQLAQAGTDMNRGVQELAGKMPELSKASVELSKANTELADGIDRYMDEGISKLYEKSNEQLDKIDRIIKIKDELLDFSQNSPSSFTDYDGAVETRTRYIIKIN